MATKRQLKKHIGYVCGDIAAELLIARHIYDGFDDEKVNAIINDIASLQVESIKNVTFDYDKARKSFEHEGEYRKARRAYFRQAYKTLLADFNNSVSEIVRNMNEAMPQEVKDANKQKE
jgi:ABC-type lipoprotein release transport system permease subunit